MVLFIAYAALVLVLVAKHRRRWTGIAILVMGLAGIIGFGWLHYRISEWTDGFIALPLMQAMLYPFAFVISLLSLFAFCLPRRHEPECCTACGYDLTGLEHAPAPCPECGLEHAMFRNLPAPADATTLIARDHADRVEAGLRAQRRSQAARSLAGITDESGVPEVR